MTLHEYLKSKKLTQYAFADLIKVSQAAVYRYVNGLRIPEEEVMPRIYVVTNGAVSANDFYNLPKKTKKKR
jgi:transcriptional regulator with XRE-family HTH domain